jgi:RimJ/RimL family protein N-acetyltransferase
MSRAWQRLAEIRARAGMGRMLRFLAGRLLCRTWETVVFDMTPLAPRDVEEWPRGAVLTVYTRDSAPMSRELDAFIRQYEPQVPDFVRNGDWVFVVTVDGQCAHFGWVGFSSRQVRVLGEPAGTPVIGHCFTAPAARGKGLFKRALRSMIGRLFERGCPRILVETHPTNEASRRGILAAGFEARRRMKIWILFNSVAVAVIEEGSRRRLGAWWI